MTLRQDIPLRSEYQGSRILEAGRGEWDFEPSSSFDFNRGAYNFFRELRKSNVGTLFRDLNLNYFIYLELEQTFSGFEKLNMN